MDSSPAVRPGSAASSGRPRGEPTVTPRRLGRFFTPRSSTSNTSRSLFPVSSPLTDITTSPTVRNNTATAESETIEFKGNPVSLRKHEIGPYQTVLLSGQKRKLDAAAAEVETPIVMEKTKKLEEPLVPIARSAIRERLGGSLRRELDWTSCNLSRSTDDYRPQLERHEGLETWYNSDKDVHIMFSSKQKDWDGMSRPQMSMAFCSAPCHTNPTIALGDDDGYVRFLDTTMDNKKGFQSELVSFAAHRNTIMDLAFSFDDLRIATAGGDNICRVFDVKTQQDIYALSGHTDSVKRVLWQPGEVGNGNILATAGRDYTVKIWDLRTRGCEVHCFSEDDVCLTPVKSKKKVPTRSIGVVNTFANLHQMKPLRKINKRGRVAKQTHNIDDQVTCMTFLPNSPNCLMTGASQQGVLKLWDIRQKGGDRSTPLSVVKTLNGIGTVAMAMNTTGTRLFTLDRASLVNAFSTQHFFQGAAPGMKPGKTSRSVTFEPSFKPVWTYDTKPEGGPPSFFTRLVCRPATAERTEMLALGSDENGAVVLHTDERIHTEHRSRYRERNYDVLDADYGDFASSAGNDFIHDNEREDCEFCSERTEEAPSLQFIHGHVGDVSSVSWTSEGNLVTCGDDLTVRLWRTEKTGKIALTACQLSKRQGYCPHHRHHHHPHDHDHEHEDDPSSDASS